ncbi:Hint domain-containing protein [uncultured Umboniibacter sp.]|uniref:Hint domain-containing protein n=1 Tax=uncultured Umboniibacter sp. TaxID=1798917 RepID=UPI0026241BE1|nr:Hint domain-containing protein [uncultured Umboniibacter sp.]
MPRQQFNFFTQLNSSGDTVYSDSNDVSFLPAYAEDGADGNANDEVAIGDYLTFEFGGSPYAAQIIGWTEYGIILQPYSGDPVLFSTKSYTSGTSLTVETLLAYPFCFLQGTEILTISGAKKIEDLTFGDTVLTHDGREQAIRWVGTQTVENNIKTSSHHAPVKIAHGALGKDIPSKDLFVTGSHAIYLDGQLINASVLVNGSTITQVSLRDMPDTFTYYHIETEAHEAIIANGLAAETFVDAPDRKAFDNYTEYVDTYGAERIIPEMDVPRITAVRHLPEDLRVSLGIKVEETDWAALVANESAALTLKQAG